MRGEQPPLVRATIAIMDAEREPSPEARWVRSWFERWGEAVRVANYSTGGFEHLWDVEGPPEAIQELPEEFTAISEWSRKPYGAVRERNARRHGRR